MVSFQGEADSGSHNDGDQSTNFELSVKPKPEVESRDYEHRPQPDSNDAKKLLTVQDAVDALGFGKFQVKLSMLTGLTWMSDAMEMMLLSILGPQLLCDWRLTTFQVALLTSAVFIGMGISSPLWGMACDNYGRKMGLTISMVWTFYYGLLSAFAPTYGWMVVLRALVGVGIGGAPQAYV